MQTKLTEQIGRARKGDRQARETLAQRALTLSVRTAQGVIGNRDQAGDIAQNVAIIVLDKLWLLRREDSFDFWVHRITVRETMRFLKRQKRSGVETTLEGVSDSAGSERSFTSASVDRLTANSALNDALKDLPADHRIALALRYVHDMSEAQIATVMRKPPGTVAAYLSRGRTALRSHPALQSFNPSQQGAVA